MRYYDAELLQETIVSLTIKCCELETKLADERATTRYYRDKSKGDGAIFEQNVEAFFGGDRCEAL